MSTFTIIESCNKETFYLNHSCMSTLSFGSEDMAWTTEDREKADLMLYKVQQEKDDDSSFEVVELF